MVNVKAQLKLYLLHVLVMVEQTIAVFPYFNMKKTCTTALEKKIVFWLFSAKKFDINGQGSYTFSAVKLKDFSRTFKDHIFKFQGPYFLLLTQVPNKL